MQIVKNICKRHTQSQALLSEVSAPEGSVEMTGNDKDEQIMAKKAFSIGQFPIQEEHKGLKQDSKVVFPRIVGHQTPETGNHFILWADELDIKGMEMTNEPLNQVQLEHLRIHHAACLIAGAVPKVPKS
ncbi:uncharacterized protein V6R79_006867 [Siganus canaliculatus]